MGCSTTWTTCKIVDTSLTIWCPMYSMECRYTSIGGSRYSITWVKMRRTRKAWVNSIASTSKRIASLRSMAHLLISWMKSHKLWWTSLCREIPKGWASVFLERPRDKTRSIRDTQTRMSKIRWITYKLVKVLSQVSINKSHLVKMPEDCIISHLRQASNQMRAWGRTARCGAPYSRTIILEPKTML